MTDSEMISKLRTMEHWVAKSPWGDMADRLQQLMEIEKKFEKMKEST